MNGNHQKWLNKYHVKIFSWKMCPCIVSFWGYGYIKVNLGLSGNCKKTRNYRAENLKMIAEPSSTVL